MGIPRTPKGEPNPELDAFNSVAEELNTGIDTLVDTVSDTLGDAGVGFDFGGMNAAKLKTTVLGVINQHFRSHATFRTLVDDKMIQDVIDQAKKQGEKGEGKKKASGMEILQSHLVGDFTQSFFRDRIDERQGDNLTSEARATRQVMMAIARRTGGSAKATSTWDADLESGTGHLLNVDEFMSDSITPFVNGETNLEPTMGSKTFTLPADENGNAVQLSMARSKGGLVFEVKVKAEAKKAREEWKEKNVKESVESLTRNYFITQQKLFEVLQLN